MTVQRHTIQDFLCKTFCEIQRLHSNHLFYKFLEKGGTAMAIHYVSPMKHQKLWNKNGIRRSLLIGPSYDSNQQLFDEHTKRTIYRPHKDGTVIWHTDIVSADPTCPYGDKSKDLQKRRQKMWNDVMKLVTPKSPRCRAFFEYALPNSFSKEQAIQCAEEFAMNLSKRINTPVDFSIHYVPKNIHVHVGCPEWQWENGKFASKGVTYYVDKNDNPIKNGVFWDKKGYPLRNPIINGDKPIILRDVDGNPVLDKQGHIQFKNQLKTKRGERRWHRFKFENITKKDVAFIHSEVDRIINAELERSGSEERITRPKCTQKIKISGS